ncbi:MAG: flagellar basal body rod protein FlgC [Acidimicrobiales bacterium]|nr:flagellar basal body rod protein FlgC [Acidimicrobiales bacterium]
MSVFGTLDIAGSGMHVSRFWLDTISHNLANANTVRPGDEEPFRAQMVVARERLSTAGGPGQGVEVSAVIRQQGDPVRVFDPAHPEADAQGYVTMPLVDLAGQMADLILATRSYQMNVQVLQDAREAYQSALKIGQR